MQVEVSVQDCFYESSPSEASSLELSHNYTDSLIAAETWETWFRRWLEILHPNIPPAPTYEHTLRLTDDAQIQALNEAEDQENLGILAEASLQASQTP